MGNAFAPHMQSAQADANASAPTVAIPVSPQGDHQQASQPQAGPGQYTPQPPSQYSPEPEYQPQQQIPVQQQRGPKTGLIVGIIIGAAVLVAAILIVVFVIKPFGPANPVPAVSSTSTSAANQSAPSSTSTSTSNRSSSSSSSSSSTTNRSGSATLSVTTRSGERISGDVRRDANGYVIADSSTREYSYNELKSKNLSDAELCIAWNEPFARNGYHFSNPDLQKYFESCSWYHDRGNSSNLTGAAAANNSTLRRIAEERESAKRWMELASN